MFKVTVYDKQGNYSYITKTVSFDKLKSCDCVRRTKPSYLLLSEKSMERLQKCKICGKEKKVKIEIMG